jgi:hypothetical protein
MSKPLSQDQLNELLGLGVKPQPETPQRPSGALSAADIAALLEAEAQKEDKPRATPDVFYRHGFDKACLFLLDLRYDNLFEPWLSANPAWHDSDGWWWRCKGCGRMVKRTGRESHHAWHKRELVV